MNKSLWILLLLAGSVFSPAFSQEFSLGPSIGANYAWMTDVPGDTRGLFNFNAGVTLVYSAQEHLGLSLDVKYSGEGVISERGNLDATAHLNYLRVPVKLIFFFNDFGDDFRPKIFAGPALGFLIGGKTETFTELGTVKVDSKDVFESFDFGGVIGAGFNYRLAERTWLNVDLGYNPGFLNVAQNGDAYNQHVNLNVGVAWGLQ